MKHYSKEFKNRKSNYRNFLRLKEKQLADDLVNGSCICVSFILVVV